MEEEDVALSQAATQEREVAQSFVSFMVEESAATSKAAPSQPLEALIFASNMVE